MGLRILVVDDEVEVEGYGDKGQEEEGDYTPSHEDPHPEHAALGSVLGRWLPSTLFLQPWEAAAARLLLVHAGRCGVMDSNQLTGQLTGRVTISPILTSPPGADGHGVPAEAGRPGVRGAGAR